MVDAVDLRFAEDLVQFVVELARRIQVSSERLLDDHPAPAGAVLFIGEPDPAHLLDDLSHLRGLGGEVVEAIPGSAPLDVKSIEPLA